MKALLNSETLIDNNKKDVGIELYRCLLMMGIILIHSQQDILFSGLIWSTTLWCVNGFAFISGFFSIKFKLSKLISIYSLALFCASISMCLAFIAEDDFTFYKWICGSFKTGRSYWYVDSYLILMLLAPAINHCTEYYGKINQWRWWIPIIILGIWSWLTELDLNQYFYRLIPQYSIYGVTPGLGSWTPLTLSLIYIFASICRININMKILSNKKYLAIFFVCGLIIVSFKHGLQNYSSPICFVLALCGFFLCRNIKLPVILKKVILFVSPSVFSIFLLHTTKYAIHYMTILEKYLYDSWHLPICLIYFVVVITVFISGLTIDLIRRFIFHLFFRHLWIKISNKIDRLIAF